MRRHVDEANLYPKLFILLYADDTAIDSDNETDLRHALGSFKTYCDTWKLNINLTKTKIIIFGKNNTRNVRPFKIGNEIIEIVQEYKYLGVYFTSNGLFTRTKAHIIEQVNKAMFARLRKIKTLDLPYDIQIELFDKTIKPILLYAIEIWSFGKNDVLEKNQLKFFKYVFNLKKVNSVIHDLRRTWYFSSYLR